MAPPRRRLRRFLLFTGGFLVALLVLVVFAPALVNVLGIGRGIVTDAIEKQLDGTFEVDAVHVGWRGPQTVRGLRIIDHGGEIVADVDVEVAGGLLALLGDGPVDVKVAGETQGVIREDGTLSWKDLALPPAQRPGMKTATPPEPPGPMRDVNVTMRDLELHLTDARSGHLYDLDLEGDAQLMGGGTSHAKLTGRTSSGGQVVIEGESMGMLDDAGGLSIAGASLEAKITVTALPVPGTDVPADIRSLVLTAQTDDLARRLIVTLDADTTVTGADDGEPVDSHLEGRLAIDRPTEPLGLRSVAGTVEGKDVPTALLRPLLAAAFVDPSRDLGRTADVSVSLPGGDGGFVVQWDDGVIDVSLTGTLDAETGAIAIGMSHIRGQLHPGLLRDVAGVERETPLDFSLSIHEATLPAVTVSDGFAAVEGGTVKLMLPPRFIQPLLLPETGGSRLARGLSLTLELDRLRLPVEPANAAAAELQTRITGGPLVITHPDATESELRNIEATLTSTALSQRVDFQLSGISRVPGQRSGRFDVSGAVMHLLDPEQPVAIDMTASVNGMPTAIVDAVADFDGLLVASIGPFLGGRATATAFGPGGGRLDATLRSELGVIRAIASGAERTLVLEGDGHADAQLMITPVLRREVLAPMFPLLADFVSSDPIRIDVRDARIPLDGDLTRLDAKLHMEFGDVTFVPESPTAGELGQVITLFTAGAGRSEVGRVRPIDISIVGGLAEIPGITIELGGHPITFAGSVDLRSSTMDLRIADLAELTGVRELGPLNHLVSLSIHGTTASPIVEPVIREAEPAEVIIDVLEEIFGGRP